MTGRYLKFFLAAINSLLKPSKQEAEIAKVIEKAVKALKQQKGGRARPSPYPRRRGRRAFNLKCFSCGKMGQVRV